MDPSTFVCAFYFIVLIVIVFTNQNKELTANESNIGAANFQWRIDFHHGDDVEFDDLMNLVPNEIAYEQNEYVKWLHVNDYNNVICNKTLHFHVERLTASVYDRNIQQLPTVEQLWIKNRDLYESCSTESMRNLNIKISLRDICHSQVSYLLKLYEVDKTQFFFIIDSIVFVDIGNSKLKQRDICHDTCVSFGNLMEHS